MQKQAREIRHFFYSQAFADGFRTAFAILLPALAGHYFHFFDIGLTLSLGAMCVSLSDAPGPIVHKRNGMLFSIGFCFLVALITPYARLNIYTMGLEIALVSFFFSMFNVYGNRATSVGNAAILIMILTMDTPIDPARIFPHALFILAGGIYYLIWSLLFYSIRPYRVAQRILGESIRELAHYLSIKADFYDVNTDLDADYRNLVSQQIVVNEKQDAVRELLFKTRQIVQESTREGRRLVFTFVETVDLFEDITASYYDYALLRKEFGHTGALALISTSLKKIARELDKIGIAIQSNAQFTRSFNYEEELKQLKTQVDALSLNDTANKLVLRKILVNIRKVLSDLNDILRYFEKDIERTKASLDHSFFVTHQSLDPRIFFNNLSFHSSVFRHALRVCIGCIAGFIVAKMIGYGHHSYWILMTISFMLKPAFSLTRQRNIERIVGTLAGGAIGVLILVLIPNKNVQFAFMVLFMIGTYSFMRIRYLVMVICTTPYVLILFSFLGTGYRSVVEERVLDTVIGCAIALSASYFLFPSWESDQLKNYMQGIVKANASYLQKILQVLSGNQLSMLEYKLARKDVYLNSANLSAAFQRMLSEPRSKQKGEKHVHQFVVLNNILYSNIATLATTLLSKPARAYPAELIQIARKALTVLDETCKKISGEQETGIFLPEQRQSNGIATSPDELLMKEQLQFVYKVSVDIEKTVVAVVGQ
jgi:uncharacterized membrane protein (TIGR01666 family)